jgi:hypothetical protein
MTNSTAEHALLTNVKTDEKDTKQILTNLLHTSTQLPAQTNSVTSTSSIDRVNTDLLVKAQDPPDASEVPLGVKMPNTKLGVGHLESGSPQPV